MTLKLNVAAYSANTRALGPGARAVIWVQGCPLHCAGCIAPNWIPNTPAFLYSPEEMLDLIGLDQVDGLTFSGGEPMEQAAALAQLAWLARSRKQINIICFTGYRYERLLKNPPNPGVSDLLDQLDVLIDGPYIQLKNNSLGLRGSTNQRVIHLTSRLKEYDLETQKRRIEVTISDGMMSLIGIPTPEIRKVFSELVPDA